MHRQLNLIFLFFYLLSSLNVGSSGRNSIDSLAGKNPFTAKASLIRYWNKEIRNNIPKPEFLLSKASPMSAAESATFAKLAAQNALSTQLPSFCSAANLFCFPDLSPSFEKHDNDSTQFTNYALEANVADQSFNTYGTKAVRGAGDFKTNQKDTNVPDLRFTSYGSDSAGREQKFTVYTANANSGSETFSNYGKGDSSPNEFTLYGNDSNVIVSDFSGYGETVVFPNDKFTSYSDHGNDPENNFNSYGDESTNGTEAFKSYRDQTNVGEDSFKSYAKNSTFLNVSFENYGDTFNGGPSNFTVYGEDSRRSDIGFKKYGLEANFKKYDLEANETEGLKFLEYQRQNESSAMAAASGRKVNKWVEPGKFFRERMLVEGTVMPMPDIRDKMPKRSFLPLPILSKLPFSTSKVSDLKQIFHAADNSTMEKILNDALGECERAPSRGETKRCVASVEDMIDFSTSVLGLDIVARTTQNKNGSNQNIMIGSVKGINGGSVTESVSCHQSLFPYLLYYCHSVPKVRVYEAVILDPNSKIKINHGVAICHVDTSAWSAGHGAFVALGSGPGRIEVCHWIFENDLTWTIADQVFSQFEHGSSST